MKNITLRQLRYFTALARHGHFGRAAEACAVTQPALSVQIRELETTLGEALLERSARHVRLTRLGQDFQARAERILRDVDELGDLARAARDHWSGPLRMGIIPTIAPYLLPRIVARLAQSYPAMDLHIRETMTPALVRELHEGRIDIALLALPIDAPGLTEEKLFDESFVLVRPAGDAAKPVPDREMLREMRLLLLEEGHCFRDQALSFCDLQPHQPREMLDGTSLSTLVQMVGAGLGVTLIPEMAVAVETGSAPVAVARFSEPQPHRRIGMLWRSSSPLGDHYRRFAAMLRAATAPADQGTPPSASAPSGG